jgi:hypothetical protein
MHSANRNFAKPLFARCDHSRSFAPARSGLKGSSLTFPPASRSGGTTPALCGGTEGYDATATTEVKSFLSETYRFSSLALRNPLIQNLWQAHITSRKWV